MRENYTLTRLYVDAALGENAIVELPKDQTHYLRNVLRKSEGDAVRLFNGDSGEWRAEITSVSKRSAALIVKELLRAPKLSPDIILCFAPVRKHRTAFIIEKATELGVRTLQPVITARTQFPKFNVEKANLQAIEAAEQTERLDIPAITQPQKLEVILEEWSPDRSLIFADEAGDAFPALNALNTLQGSSAILIGPEGGFTPQERELLSSKTFVRSVSLGPRILRADTAALSLLTLWQAVQGDWG